MKNFLIRYGNCGMGDFISSTMFFREWKEQHSDGNLLLQFTKPFQKAKYSCILFNNPNVRIFDGNMSSFKYGYNISDENVLDFEWSTNNKFEIGIESKTELMSENKKMMSDNIYACANSSANEMFHTNHIKRFNDVYLTDSEKNIEIKTDKKICVFSNGFHPHFTNARNWGWRNFDKVVSALKDKILFIQVGEERNGFVHHRISGAVDLVNKSPIRYTFSLCQKADFVLTHNSSLLHQAAIPANENHRTIICVLGGRDPYLWTDCYKIDNVDFEFVYNNDLMNSIGCLDEKRYCCNCALTRRNKYSNETRLCKHPVFDGSKYDDFEICECFSRITAEEIIERFKKYL